MRLLRPKDRTVHDEILRHYRGIWPRQQVVDAHFTPGPVADRLPDFHMVRIAPGRGSGMWAFATIGAWRATEGEAQGLEFVAVAKDDNDMIPLHLAMAAYYHAGSPEQRLGVGHTVSIGEGWVEGSPLNVVLVSRPIIWGPMLEHCQLDGRHVQVLWLIPIHESEREYKKANGLDALEELFEATSFDYLDPFRRAVA